MSAITFTSTAYTINSHLIIPIPLDASTKLSSRGMVMADVTINDVTETVPLEPDGNKSHWFELDRKHAKKMKISDGSTIQINLVPTDDWIEPIIPDDISNMLKKSKKARATWDATTTKARWEWLRWIRSTASDATRAKRIGVAASKLVDGKKRPCCFNASMCTVPEVSKSGVLISHK